MGQSNWAWGCALFLAVTIGGHAVAQKAQDPFAKDGAASSVAASPSKAIPAAVAARNSEPCNARDRAEQRINSVLNQPLSEPLEFVEQPLRDVVTILSETYDIPILFDVAALDAVAASPDVEVNIQINNLTLRSALDLMLRNAGAEALTYIIDNEVLLITTLEEAETRLEVIVYRVDDLLPSASLAWQSDSDFDRLIDVITASIEHESWMVNGTGEGEIKAFPPGMIIISQTHRVHEQVQEFLEELRCNKAKVETATADSRAVAAKRPVSRSIAVNSTSVAAEDSQRRIREALIKSVDWNPTDAEITEDDKFLLVLSDRVLVRHLPQVVAQVEHSVKDLKLTPLGPSGSFCDGERDTRRDPHLAEPANASEDGGGRNSRGGGMF